MIKCKNLRITHLRTPSELKKNREDNGNVPLRNTSLLQSILLKCLLGNIM